MRPTTFSAALALVALLAACGSSETAPGAKSSPAEVGPHEEPGDLDAPPPVTVRYGDESVVLEPWTYCYGNGCADGSPPANPHHVGSPDEVLVEFPLEGWTFDASFTPAGDECGRTQRVTLTPSGDAFTLRPAGYAGEYDVTLTGKGDGDLFVTFRWETTADGRLPEPKSTLAILADNDGRVDSYGVTLEIRHLAETPRRAAATITVRSADGSSLSFDASRPGRGCQPEGTLRWDGPDEKGLEATRLGEGPFTYEVELMLDGERYTATATWPDDEIPSYGPFVRLDFEPDLPRLE